jgi:hypothetical protein
MFDNSNINSHRRWPEYTVKPAIEKKIGRAVAKNDLTEKIGQMTQRSGAGSYNETLVREGKGGLTAQCPRCGGSQPRTENRDAGKPLSAFRDYRQRVFTGYRTVYPIPWVAAPAGTQP